MPLHQQETFSIELAEITASDRVKELGLSLSPNINFDQEKVFPQIDGWGWKSQIKKKVKLLNNIESLLEDCLFEGEQVLYIAKGNQYSFGEQVFLGIWASAINHTVFVLTNVRLLMFRTNSKGIPKKTFWMVYYNQIIVFKGNWRGMLTLKLKDGRKLNFTSFPKADRKIMPKVFEEILENFRKTQFDPEVSQSLENLCSHCLDQVPKAEFTCNTCQSIFWSPKELALRSLIFPSWGDFLMGHTLIAFLELFGGIATWLYLIGAISVVLSGGNPILLGSAIFSIMMFNGLDAIITYRVASKGLHPRSVPVVESIA
ncbi:MAG: hypothetical protein JKY95_07445 [Planctomycetaceae bacterium]|nr:hypothetical protein [Planctomycetaceae bacterium]